MKFLFQDDAFSFETHIGEGDEASWHKAWKATAQRLARIGEQALASGHRVSAQEALLRASNYFEKAPTGASTTLATLTGNEGAGEHTHAGGLGRAHQTMFDWLDRTLAASSAPRTVVGASVR